jgi:hypothetical protein
MNERWHLIRVELLSGGGQEFLSPPGRDMVVSTSHSFRQLAEVINAGFARWDLSHLYAFLFTDGPEIGIPIDEEDEEEILDAATSKIGRRDLGEAFEFEFDLGDSWMHRCTVRAVDMDPRELFEERPRGPAIVFGWGDIPDQYGRTVPDD